MVAVRTPSALKARVQQIAKDGNSTLAAAVRWGLEKFVEENASDEPAAPAKAELFD